MEYRIRLLEDRLAMIDDKLDRLLQLCETDILPNCNRMGRHITFIETVYDHIKHPLGYMCSLVSGSHNQATLLDTSDKFDSFEYS